MTRFEEHLERIFDAYNGMEIDAESAAKLHTPTLLGLALTWKDVRFIIKEADSMLEEQNVEVDSQGNVISETDPPFMATEQTYYEEVLRQFNKQNVNNETYAMRAREYTQWIRVLSEARIGDIITFHGMSIKVCEGDCYCTRTRDCAFFNKKYKKEGDEYCLLDRGEGAVPCLAGNNALCKSLTFVKIDY